LGEKLTVPLALEIGDVAVQVRAGFLLDVGYFRAKSTHLLGMVEN
jgi:hypothetical protein